MSPPEPGERLAGRYELRTVIGRSRMGAVWLARDQVLCRDVAVKEISLPPHLSGAEREVLRANAVREARTAARLSHPNIVTVHDIVETDGMPWIVMQLLPYLPLSDAVREDGPLSPSEGPG